VEALGEHLLREIQGELKAQTAVLLEMTAILKSTKARLWRGMVHCRRGSIS
jgi:hypothetical protein